MAEKTPKEFTIRDEYSLVDDINAYVGMCGVTQGGPMQPHVMVVLKVRGHKKEALLPLDAADCDVVIKALIKARDETFGGATRPKDPRRPWRR